MFVEDLVVILPLSKEGTSFYFQINVFFIYSHVSKVNEETFSLEVISNSTT